MKRIVLYTAFIMACMLFIAATPCNTCEIMTTSKYPYCLKEKASIDIINDADVEPSIHPLFLLTPAFPAIH